MLARHHNIPFVIAAPSSTIDSGIASGAEIEIEERGSEELTHAEGVALAPEGTPVLNPAFDVTAGSLIDAIITEKGAYSGLRTISQHSRTLGTRGTEHSTRHRGQSAIAAGEHRTPRNFAGLRWPAATGEAARRYQLSAWLMAAYLHPLDADETAWLTLRHGRQRPDASI